ncbi:MAG TPA: IS110 family transposase, partial [Acidimicrobiales bacterium]
MVLVGVDWAEDHHDVCVMAEAGEVLGKRRVPDSVVGIGELHALVAEHAEENEAVIVGIEIDRGLVIWSLLAAGYEVYAVNPMASARYRDRHATSGAKSDPGDAKVLADLVRTDRHNHRPIAGDSDLAEGVKLLARAHQSAIWDRQRQVNALRSALREYYPGALDAFGTDLSSMDALAVLAIAPTPELGRGLSRSKIASALRRGGRQRNIDRRAVEIQAALRADQLEAPEVIARAHGLVTRSALALITTFNEQINELEVALSEHFEQHPDAKVVLSLPGLGTVLGARVLGEFGDDRTRFSGPKSRKNYAGTSPVTKASGRSRVVLARYSRNRRLADACDRWAFCALNSSPGARDYYDQLRARGKTHHQALRQLSNRLVGILHVCLER